MAHDNGYTEPPSARAVFNDQLHTPRGPGTGPGRPPSGAAPGISGSLLVGIFATLSLGNSTSGHAADDATASPEGLQEIVVTAQKRSESLQSTPLAIQAVAGADLAQRQITGIGDLTQAMPNVNFGETLGNAQINIRGLGFQGIAAGNEGRVAYQQDDVYIARPTDQLGQYFDVSRVEVLYGPQGTLYGRNATGGVINVITNNPTDHPEGYLSLTGGDYDLIRSEGAISGPLASNISGRLAFVTDNRGGYGHDLATGTDAEDSNTKAVRGKLRFDLNERLDLTLVADYFHEKDHGNYSLIGQQSTGPLFGTLYGGIGFVTPNKFDNYFNLPSSNFLENYGALANLHWALDNLDLRSISSYRHGTERLGLDIDATSYSLGGDFQSVQSWQASEELRVSQTFSLLDWQAGLFYFREHQLALNDAPLSLSFLAQPLPPLPVGIGLYNSGFQNTNAVAGYGTLRYHLTSQLDVEAGGRYSYEKKTTTSGALTDFLTPAPVAPLPAYPFPAAAVVGNQVNHWDSFTPAVTLDYKALEDLMLFFRYAKGFKSGGYNLGYDQPPFNPEKVSSYEAGLKSSWLDRRLTANLSAFYYDYTDLQVQELLGLQLVIVNAARADVKGLELSVEALPIQQLRLNFSAGLLDARYGSYASIDPARASLGVLQLAGNRLTNAPPYTVNASADYTIPTSAGNFVLRAESRFVAKNFLSQYNLDTQSAPKTTTTNVFLRYLPPSGPWSVSLWAKNLENKIVPTADSVTAGGGDPITGSLSPPRTYGVTVRYDR